MERLFDPVNKKKLDSPKKREMLPPNKVLLDMGLTNGEFIADIGCGIGYFTFPAAEIVSSSGKVFAVDISEAMIEDVERRAENSNYSNIRTVISSVYDFKLLDMSCDVVLLSTVLHEVDDTDVFLNEARRILKENGKITVIDWSENRTDWGPPEEHRISMEKCVILLENHGFHLECQKKYGDDFYMVVASKSVNNQ